MFASHVIGGGHYVDFQRLFDISPLSWYLFHTVKSLASSRELYTESVGKGGESIRINRRYRCIIVIPRCGTVLIYLGDCLKKKKTHLAGRQRTKQEKSKLGIYQPKNDNLGVNLSERGSV